MANWDYDMVAFVKGDPQEVLKMRKRLSVILQELDKLDDADWIRKLFGDELSEIKAIGKNTANDGFVTDTFSGFKYDWDSIDVVENPLHFDASDMSKRGPGLFVDALVNCFPRVEFWFITTGYISWGAYLAYVDDDFDQNSSIEWGEESGGAGVLDAYKKWKYAICEDWILPDNASKEERAKAKQKIEDAEMVFTAFQYVYHFLDTDEGILLIVEVERDYLKGTYSVPITEKFLSVIYDQCGDAIKIMDFNSADYGGWDDEDLPNIPENIAKAVKDGKLTLKGR